MPTPPPPPAPGKKPVQPDIKASVLSNELIVDLWEPSEVVVSDALSFVESNRFLNAVFDHIPEKVRTQGEIDSEIDNGRAKFKVLRASDLDPKNTDALNDQHKAYLDKTFSGEGLEAAIADAHNDRLFSRAPKLLTQKLAEAYPQNQFLAQYSELAKQGKLSNATGDNPKFKEFVTGIKQQPEFQGEGGAIKLNQFIKQTFQTAGMADDANLALDGAVKSALGKLDLTEKQKKEITANAFKLKTESGKEPPAPGAGSGTETIRLEIDENKLAEITEPIKKTQQAGFVVRAEEARQALVARAAEYGARDPFAKAMGGDKAKATLQGLYDQMPKQGRARMIVDAALGNPDMRIVIIEGNDTNAYMSKPRIGKGGEIPTILGFNSTSTNELYMASDSSLPKQMLLEESMHNVIKNTYRNDKAEPWQLTRDADGKTITGPLLNREGQPVVNAKGEAVAHTHRRVPVTDARKQLLLEAFRADIESNGGGREGLVRMRKDLGLMGYGGSRFASEAVVKIEVQEAVNLPYYDDIADKYPELDRFRKEIIHTDIEAYLDNKPLGEIDAAEYRSRGGYHLEAIKKAPVMVEDTALGKKQFSIPVDLLEGQGEGKTRRIIETLEKLGINREVVAEDGKTVEKPGYRIVENTAIRDELNKAGDKAAKGTVIEIPEEVLAGNPKLQGELEKVTQPAATLLQNRTGFLKAAQTLSKPGFSLAGNTLAVYGGTQLLLNKNELIPDSVRYLASGTQLVAGGTGIYADIKSKGLAADVLKADALGNAATAESKFVQAGKLKTLGNVTGGIATGVMVPVDSYLAYESFKNGDTYQGSQHAASATSGTLILTSIATQGTKVAAVAGPAGVVIAIGAMSVDIGVKSNQIYDLVQDTNRMGESLGADQMLRNNPGITKNYQEYWQENQNKRAYQLPPPETSEYANIGAAKVIIKKRDAGDFTGDYTPEPDKFLTAIGAAKESLEQERKDIIEKHPLAFGRLDSIKGRNDAGAYAGGVVLGDGWNNDIVRLNEIDKEVKVLDSARVEVAGDAKGQINGKPYLLSYEKRYTDLQTAKADYQKVIKEIEPQIPAMEKRVAELGTVSADYRAAVGNLRAAYEKELGEVPDMPEYARLKTASDTLAAESRKDKSDTLIYALSLNAKADELALAPANAYAVNKDIAARIVTMAGENQELMESAAYRDATKPWAKDLDPEQEKLNGIARKRNAEYGSAMQESNLAKIEFAEKFGEPGEQEKRIKDKDPAILDAIKQLREKENATTIAYIRAVGAERKAIDRLLDMDPSLTPPQEQMRDGEYSLVLMRGEKTQSGPSLRNLTVEDHIKGNPDDPAVKAVVKLQGEMNAEKESYAGALKDFEAGNRQNYEEAKLTIIALDDTNTPEANKERGKSEKIVDDYQNQLGSLNEKHGEKMRNLYVSLKGQYDKLPDYREASPAVKAAADERKKTEIGAPEAREEFRKVFEEKLALLQFLKEQNQLDFRYERARLGLDPEGSGRPATREMLDAYYKDRFLGKDATQEKLDQFHADMQKDAGVLPGDLDPRSPKSPITPENIREKAAYAYPDLTDMEREGKILEKFPAWTDVKPAATPPLQASVTVSSGDIPSAPMDGNMQKALAQFMAGGAPAGDGNAALPNIQRSRQRDTGIT